MTYNLEKWQNPEITLEIFVQKSVLLGIAKILRKTFKASEIESKVDSDYCDSQVGKRFF